ncbi:putative Glycosyl transferase group 1 [Nitrospira japonica]|uniref:Putative Glycosyl transferase group 1 n=1 Tax=Nitrospira japonica TaxID=1325564 RepID=A0A1W1HZK7_9BACT|nr:glycosyltransferase family 4 protein [Nitrospira japonica]SLM46174.1 putative Glycosyl transferase group 1 [Nitrospira japonica]
MAQRILYIHGVGAVGGAEHDLLAVLARLDRAAWEPHVVCPAEGPFRTLLEREGLTVHPLALVPWRKWFSPFVRWRSVGRLRDLVDRLRPALLHVNDIWWVPHTLGALRGAAASPPIVAHVRQEIEPEKVRRYELDRIERVIGISEHVAESLKAGGVETRKLRMVYSGIDFSRRAETAAGGDRSDVAEVRRRLGVPAAALLLGTAANLFPRKGYEVMLRALPGILAVHPDVHYLLAGTAEPAYAASLRALAVDLGITERIHMVGFQDPIRPFLDALDLYVHPALMEGFGIALVEAMAAGKAVVATRTGGVPEVVEQGETGLLVAPGDSERLRAAVLELLGDEPRRVRMGAKGFSRARARFDLDRTVADLERIYREAVVEQRGGHADRH